MIIVIADDLTGAAEIAGIGHSYGLSTALLIDVADNLPVSDLIVIATDTRSMTEQDAVNETHRICQAIKLGLPKLTEARYAAMTPLKRAQAMAKQDDILHLFKKTDSALRGHVHLELRALIEESRYEQVMYMPANPSMGRTIRGGRYFVNGLPIDQTDFSRDPEFPATTANVAAAIDVMPGSRLRICDAEDAQDVHRTVKMAINNRIPTLLAGAADLFCAFLEELGRKPTRAKSFHGLNEKGAALIVCGSTQSIDLSSQPYVRRHNMASIPMPREVFDNVTNQKITPKEAADKWMGRLKQTQVVAGKTASFILTLPYPSSGTREGALALRQVTGDMTQRIAKSTTLSELIIEGGATAHSAIKALGWTRFHISNVIGPGIVRMQCLDATATHLTIKPGSYDWKDLFA